MRVRSRFKIHFGPSFKKYFLYGNGLSKMLRRTFNPRSISQLRSVRRKKTFYTPYKAKYYKGTGTKLSSDRYVSYKMVDEYFLANTHILRSKTLVSVPSYSGSTVRRSKVKHIHRGTARMSVKSIVHDLGLPPSTNSIDLYNHKLYESISNTKQFNPTRSI